MYQVFIPSKGRPNSKIFREIPEAIIVVEPQDRQDYLLYNHHLKIITLPENNKGIAYARQYILDFARKADLDWFWQIDDDISAFYEIIDRKSKKISPQEALNGAENIFRTIPYAAQACLEYGQYACHQSVPLEEYSHCEAVTCINVARTRDLSYNTDLILKEDKDFSLKALMRGLNNIRVKKYAFASPTVGTKKGGLHSVYANPYSDTYASEMIQNLWGNKYVSVVKKKTGRVDVRIKWKKFSQFGRLVNGLDGVPHV